MSPSPSEVSVVRLETAIRIWEEMVSSYKTNMANIRSNRPLTWWLSMAYWQNERQFHRSFSALIKRRVQLQTARKEQSNG